MIVIPHLLADQLVAADEQLNRRLALDFAEHALEVCKGALEDAAPLERLLATARAFLDGRASIDDLNDAYRVMHRATVNQRGLLGELGTTVQLALLAAHQRDLEQTGVHVHVRYQPDARAVAKHAQIAVARWYASRLAGSDDQDAAVESRRAKWEEARWQLARLVELAPNPHEQG